MSEANSTPIIHLIGPPGGGKTTLCRMFLDAFPEKSILAVDASKDGFLTLSYGIHSPMSMAAVLQQIDSMPLNREALDWALQDLPVSIPSESEADILFWGDLPQTLTPIQHELLEYGLPRLLRTYDVVIWDGPLGVISTLLKPSDIRSLIVITPEDEAYCQQTDVEPAMLLLSKAQAIDILPPTAAFQTQRGNWKFLGKLPPLSPPEKRIKELPQYFQDCFHKLDLPFELRPRLV